MSAFHVYWYQADEVSVRGSSRRRKLWRDLCVTRKIKSHFLHTLYLQDLSYPHTGALWNWIPTVRSRLLLSLGLCIDVINRANGNLGTAQQSQGARVPIRSVYQLVITKPGQSATEFAWGLLREVENYLWCSQQSCGGQANSSLVMRCYAPRRWFCIIGFAWSFWQLSGPFQQVSEENSLHRLWRWSRVGWKGKTVGSNLARRSWSRLKLLMQKGFQSSS